MFHQFVKGGIIIGLGVSLMSPLPIAAQPSVAGHRSVCGVAQLGTMRCLADLATDVSGQPLIAAHPDGYGPHQFHTAYNLPATAVAPVTVAIVGAYDNSKAKSDLDVYDQTYGLPVFPTCTSKTQTSCFSKYDQRGGHTYPSHNSGWTLESDLDIQTAHEICQNCKLIMVEADSPSLDNLAAAANEAAALGARVISNSYGGSESSTEKLYDSDYSHSGVVAVASSGDSGYGVSYPAASAGVVAVGGTTLKLTSTDHRTSETAWSGSGSGCSHYEAKPAYQTDSGCVRRTVADVAADADPATGAAVYDSYGYSGQKGWFVIGGTSLAAPLVAGIFGLGSNKSNNAASLYASSSKNFFDVISGSNGSCRPSYLCHALSGFDGPTGLGSPGGLGAF